MPSEIIFPDYVSTTGARVQWFGAKQKLKWTQSDDGMAVQLPKDLWGKTMEYRDICY